MGNKYNVSQISTITKLSAYTLRYYEQIGLLPNIARDRNGYRIYSDNDIALIQFLNCLKGAGMPVKTMIEFIRLMYEGEIPSQLKILKQHKRNVEKRIELLQGSLTAVNYKIDYYTKKIGSPE